MKPSINSVKNIEARKAFLKQSIIKHEEQLGKAYLHSKHNLPKFILKKAILPSALLAIASKGLNRIAKKNLAQNQTYATTPNKQSFWQRILVFVLPIVQEQLRKYLNKR